MAYQSLYRRYRPSRFSQLRGQGHVVAALQNAVRNDSVTHAYLFSGPRGTGKTSTARILAKALNCQNSTDGEPCGECQSCKDMEAGQSFDLFELDAASNNGVEAIRDLIERAAVGSPGRTKVYILDEVHMLSPAASNALLKTLEEPPGHVRFVLATTDPQKVLPTIKSRTQHFEFQLLSAEELDEYVRWIAQDAGLDLDDESIRWAIRQGKGSARDTLSALDQVVAAGGVVERAEPVEQLLEALADKNPGTAIVAIADSLNLGHDPRVLGRALLDVLRDVFLISLGAPVPHLVPEDVERMTDWAARLGTPLLTRSMEAVGTSLVDMRQAADPRVPLEVAMVRLASADSASVSELVDRIERLEAAIANGATASGSPAGTPATPPAAQKPSGASQPGDSVARDDSRSRSDAGLSGAERAKADLARRRAARGGGTDSDSGSARASAPPVVPKAAPAAPSVPSAPSAPRVPSVNQAAPDAPAGASAVSQPDPLPPESRAPAGASPSVPVQPTEVAVPEGAVQPVHSDAPAGASQSPPSSAPESEASAPAGASGNMGVDQLNEQFTGSVLSTMKGVAKALYSQGSFVAYDGTTATFLVENTPTKERAEKSRSDVEALLSSHLGRPVTIHLTDSADSVGSGSGSRSPGQRPGGDRAPTNDQRGSGGDRPPRTPDQPAETSTGIDDRTDHTAPTSSAAPGVPSPPAVPRGPGAPSVPSTPPRPRAAQPGSSTRPSDRTPPPPSDEPEPTEPPEDDYLSIDISELEDAPDVAQTGLDRILEAFPGAKVVQKDPEQR